MPWLTSATDAGRTTANITRRWVYQYAKVDEDFEAAFDITDTAVVKAGVVTGDEVVRRIYQQVKEYKWPGLTEDAATAKANELYALPEYGAITMPHNGAGGHTLCADETTYETAGWSRWIKVSDFEEWVTSI